MTMNIPLSLVTAANKNAPDNSPVLWDGADFVVSKEHLINIVQLRSDLNLLITKQAGYSSDFAAATTANEQVKRSIYDIDANHNMAAKKIEGATKDTANIAEQTGLTVLAMDEIEQVFEASKLTMDEAVKLVNLVKGGSLINLAALNVSDLGIARSKLGEYTFVDSALDPVTILPGKNVSIAYSLVKGNYSLSFDFPKTSDLVKSGNMINVDTKPSGTTTMSIIPTAVQVQSGLVVSLGTQHLYRVSFGDKFITADTGGGMFCRREGSGFVIGLTEEVMNDAAVDYVFRNGLTKVGDTVSLDSTLFPKLSKGSGSALSQNGNSTTLSFDYDSVDKPVQAVYSVGYPVTVTKTDDRGILSRISYSIEPTWLAQSSAATKLLEKTESFASILATKVNAQRSWADTHEGMRSALACPILNLYKFIKGETSAAVSGTTRDSALFNTFGAGASQVGLNINVLPYVSMMPSYGSEFVIGQEQEFDLYVILQHYLRKRMKDAAFTIADSERGTKFKILEVGTAMYGKRRKDDIQAPYYNMELDLESFTNVAVFSPSCPHFAPPANWTSGLGFKYRVTGGDLDFITGKARNGQTNADVLLFPDDLDQTEKVSMLSATQTRVYNGVEFEFVVHIYNEILLSYQKE